jgi:hypothetical protein
MVSGQTVAVSAQRMALRLRRSYQFALMQPLLRRLENCPLHMRRSVALCRVGSRAIATSKGCIGAASPHLRPIRHRLALVLRRPQTTAKGAQTAGLQLARHQEPAISSFFPCRRIILVESCHNSSSSPPTPSPSSCHHQTSYFLLPSCFSPLNSVHLAGFNTARFIFGLPWLDQAPRISCRDCRLAQDTSML